MPTSTLVNDVKVISSTVGIGPLTLGAALTAYRGVEALIDGETYSYSIHQGDNREYGRGVFTAATNGFTRGVINSSASNTPIALQNGAIVAIVLLVEDLEDRIGIPAEFTIGTVTAGPPGSTPVVTISGISPNFVLDFTLAQGVTGDTPVITIGTVTTGAPGSAANAYFTGSASAPVLNFAIPRGDTGNTGPTPNLTIGTVTGGTIPSVTITGTALNPVLNFVLPINTRLKSWRLTAPRDVPLASAVGTLIDGRATVLNDNILLANQNDQRQNGLYTQGSTALTRATDAAIAGDIQGMYGWATDGDQNIGRQMRDITATTITLGTTPIVFAIDAPNSPSLATIFAKPNGTFQFGPGDSNINGRVNFIGLVPRIWTGPGCPLEGWTTLNMAQNGSSAQGWIDTLATGDPNQAPADYSGIVRPTVNIHQCFNGNPDGVLVSIGINDMNSVATRAANGVNIERSIDRIMLYGISRGIPIIAMTPQPFAMPDFVSGPTSTDWGGDAATWGFTGPNAAQDNCAYWTRRLANAYLRWVDRNPLVHVIDTRNNYVAGSIQNPALDRCDNFNTDCLDPLTTTGVFYASITGTELAVSSIVTGAVGLLRNVNWSSAAGVPWANPGVIAGAVITGQITGSAGGVGSYQLAAAPAGGDVSNRLFTIYGKKITDGLHKDDAGWNADMTQILVEAGIINLRRRSSTLKGSSQSNPSPDDAGWTRMFTSGLMSGEIYYNSRSGTTNTTFGMLPSPEALFLRTDPRSRFLGTRPSALNELTRAETASFIANKSSVKQLAAISGTNVIFFIRGGTGTIYTASVGSVSVSPNPFNIGLTLNGANTTGEPASGSIIWWVEDANAVPFGNRKEIILPVSGTRGAAYYPYSDTWTPTRYRFVRPPPSTGGAITIDMRLHNQVDGRFIQGSVNFGTSAGMVIATLTLGAGINTLSYTDATLPVNTTNRDTMIAAALWPAGLASLQLQNGYWIDLLPSATIDQSILRFD